MVKIATILLMLIYTMAIGPIRCTQEKCIVRTCMNLCRHELNLAAAHTEAHHHDLLRHAVNSVQLDDPEALYLEFGVFSGSSIRVLAHSRPGEGVVHGFDSFEGLPEFWRKGFGKGKFNVKKKLPKGLPENVQLHVGWFDETVPNFKSEHAHEAIAFMHLDADLYSSTKKIFDHLGSQLRPGSVLLFDEMINYPGWEEHEYKAFIEFVDLFGVEHQYIGRTTQGNCQQVAVLITGMMQRVPFAQPHLQPICMCEHECELLIGWKEEHLHHCRDQCKLCQQ
jgi:Methyltransferase domain